MLFDKVKQIIEENSSVDCTDITLDSELADVSRDSLEKVDLLVTMEQEFQVRFDLRQDLITVRDLVEYIQNSLQE